MKRMTSLRRSVAVSAVLGVPGVTLLVLLSLL